MSFYSREQDRIREGISENFNPTKAAKEYFEEAGPSEAVDIMIFMRDHYPTTFDQFMSLWAYSHEEMLRNRALNSVPDGPEDGGDR